jgi:hypothetical protein
MKKLPLLAILALLVFSSCTKEEIVTKEIVYEMVDPEQNEVNGLLSRSVSSVDGLDLGCISVDYPFEMLRIDSSTVVISSEEDFIEAISDPEVYPFDFVYPLFVTDDDDNSQVVENADELAELFVDCVPDIGWDDDFADWFFPAWVISYETSCYQLVYPVILVDQDSMPVTANDEDEFISLLSDGNIYSFAFPLSLEDEEGEFIEVEDADELFDLLYDCYPDPGPGGCGIGTFGCYELGYPITLALVDGTSIVVNDDDEFANVLLSGDWAGFVYPITLIDDDGNDIIANNEDELNEALLECNDFGGPGLEGDFICYNFEYPIQIDDLISSTVITINDSDEWIDYLFNGGVPFGFIYPITLINVETDDAVTVNTEDEFFEALNECW